MKIIVIVFCLFFVYGCARTEKRIASGEAADALVKAGLVLHENKQPSYDFRLKTPEGNFIAQSDIKGKLILLNFWTTWCPPCRFEMPSMEALYERLKPSGFEIIACNIMEDEATVKNFVRLQNLTFPVVLDESGNVSVKYGVQAIPATFIIDRGGIIVASAVGGRDWNSQDIINAFETLLKNE